jgi:hypothetical protein
VKRWREWSFPAGIPFAPGDKIVWRNRKFTVIDANQETGTLMDDHGKIYKHFTWGGGRWPKKIGVDPKFVLRAEAA